MKKWIDEFKTPSNEFKPKIRYWIPHSFVSEKGIQMDIKDLHERGFGSIESVSMRRGIKDELFGKDNMWGSKKWIEAIKIILKEAKKYDMKVDICNGPGWPIANINSSGFDDESSLYELCYGLKILSGSIAYDEDIPKPSRKSSGTAVLKAVSLYKITDDKKIDFSSYIALPLEEKVKISVSDTDSYALFSFWERPSDHTNSKIFNIIDHLSKKATDAVMDCWETQILPEFCGLSSQIESIFCDSLEYRTTLDWSRNFAEGFEKRKGYSIIPYLPCLGNPETAWSEDRNLGIYPPSEISGYEFSDTNLQHKVNFDYLEQATYMFCENHLKYMQQRAEKIGLNIRYQVAYNRNLEAECSALCVGIPENEALGRPLLDNFRDMSAAVNLGRKKIYSFECAAEPFNSYGQTHKDILWWAKRSYAGGMNAQVFHGAGYCGYYENGVADGVDWPGFEAFTNRTWSNMWNRTLNKSDQKYILNYLARCNFILRNPHKVDVAVYRHDYSNDCHHKASDGNYIYKDNNALNNAGYTYEFISPELLNHKNATVSNGIFDIDGAGYKAIIINNQEYMEYNTAQKLLQFSNCGLKVIFVGVIPSKTFLKSEQYTDKELKEVISKIDCEIVSQAEDVPEILKKNGILPDVMPSVECEIRPVHVKIEGGDFYYVYNSHSVSNADLSTFYPKINKEKYMKEYFGDLSLKGEGNVYQIDAFSGEIIKTESVSDCGRVVLKNQKFMRDEAKIFAVLSDEQAKEMGIVCHDEKVIKGEFDTIDLGEWCLEIEQILPPEDRTGTFYESEFKKLKPIYLTELKPWSEIVNELVCGTGIYKAELVLDSLPQIAFLKLENVCDTYHIFVNGVKFESGDPVKKQTDITKALKCGKNNIEIVVSSTIQNVASYKYLKENGKKEQPEKNGIWGKTCVIVK